MPPYNIELHLLTANLTRLFFPSTEKKKIVHTHLLPAPSYTTIRQKYDIKYTHTIYSSPCLHQDDYQQAYTSTNSGNCHSTTHSATQYNNKCTVSTIILTCKKQSYDGLPKDLSHKQVYCMIAYIYFHLKLVFCVEVKKQVWSILITEHPSCTKLSYSHQAIIIIFGRGAQSSLQLQPLSEQNTVIVYGGMLTSIYKSVHFTWHNFCIIIFNCQASII